MDVDKAFEVRDGFLVEDGPFYTGGTSSPVGLGLPFNTVYCQTLAAGHLIWKKVGAGDLAADWRQYSAQDVPMDISTLDGSSPDLTGNTTVFDSLSTLSNRLFGSFFGAGRSNPNFQTTSATFVDALVLNIPNARAGKYILSWSYRTYNTKNNTDNQTEVRFNDLALVNNLSDGNILSIYSFAGGLGEQFTGFGEFTIVDLANLKLSLAIKRTSGNGGARINTMNIMAWRVSN